MFRYKQQIKKNDEPAKLPKNRKELFFDVVKGDFSLLVNLSIFCFLFSLPLVAVFSVQYLLLTQLREVSLQAVFPVVFYGGLAAVPCWGLRYTARSAAFGVMKKRVFNEGCLVSETFWRYCKEGFGRSFLAGALVGASLWLAVVGSVYVGFVATNSFAQGLGIGILVLQFALVFAAAEYFCAQHNLYALTFGGYMRNGFSFCLMGFLPSLLHFALCCALPFALCALSLGSAIATAGVMALFCDGLSVLVATLYAFSVFDHYINSANYPDMVGKGLFADGEENNG